MYLDDILPKTLWTWYVSFLAFLYNLRPLFLSIWWNSHGKELVKGVNSVCDLGTRPHMTRRVCLMLSPHSNLKLFFSSSTMPLTWEHPYVSSPLRMALPFMKIFIIILISLCFHLSNRLKIAGIILLGREVTVSGAPRGHDVIMHICHNLFNVLSVSIWSKIPFLLLFKTWNFIDVSSS